MTEFLVVTSTCLFFTLSSCKLIAESVRDDCKRECGLTFIVSDVLFSCWVSEERSRVKTVKSVLDIYNHQGGGMLNELVFSYRSSPIDSRRGWTTNLSEPLVNPSFKNNKPTLLLCRLKTRICKLGCFAALPKGNFHSCALLIVTNEKKKAESIDMFTPAAMKRLKYTS